MTSTTSLNQQIKRISGPPGTGKSTHLLNAVEQLLGTGVAPESIIFTTFTRAGAYEARDRACAKFKLPQQSLPYFRTIHSLCYQSLPSRQMMTASDWCVIAKSLGLHFTLKFSQEEGIPRGHTKGDYLLSLWSLGRVNLQTPRMVFDQRHGYSTSLPDLTFQEFEHFIQSVTAYKTETGKCDYTDLLETWLASGAEIGADYLIVDEAQDLSALQWECVWKMACTAKAVWIAGDDDQCIHEWNGASPRHFIELKTTEQTVLPQSYRIPANVHKLANSIIQKVTLRVEKEYKPRDEPGTVTSITDLEQANLSSGSWLLLARNQIYLNEYAALCRRRGYLYTSPSIAGVNEEIIKAIATWASLANGLSVLAGEAKSMYQFMSQRDRIAWGFKKKLGELNDGEQVDYQKLKDSYGMLAMRSLHWTKALDMVPPEERAYFSAVEKKNGFISKPRIEISTIHGAKGKEADHVLLRTDMTQRTFESYGSSPNAEHRVWYVGVTRAKQTLTILNATSDQAYQL